MASSIRRQLTDQEKEEILRIHGRICFATRHPIPAGEKIHFDHIRALDAGGSNELNNIAPMCAEHNMQKKTMSLGDFRTKLRIQEFFAQETKQTLNHLLQFCKKQKMIDGFGAPVSISHKGDKVVLSPASPPTIEAPLHKCPTTGWEYFYMTLPVALIDSDDGTGENTGLQPRYLMEDKVFGLYQHFHKYPVLQPSIGRIDGARVKIFDGQHKIAGLLWNERDHFECKIYSEGADVRRLNLTNINAHNQYSQTRFAAPIMISKLGGIFVEAFDEYSDSSGEERTESGLLEFIMRRNPGMTAKSDLMKTFRSGLYSLVLKHESNNGIYSLVSESSRKNEHQPITVDMLDKSLFKNFMVRDVVADDMNTDSYKRRVEIDNMAFFFNLFYEEGLNCYAEAGKDERRRLKRIMGSKSMIAWSGILKGAICGVMGLLDEEERKRPFYRDLSDDTKDKIRKVVRRLMNWALWDSPEEAEIDKFRNSAPSVVRNWFRDHGLHTDYLLGGGGGQ